MDAVPGDGLWLECLAMRCIVSGIQLLTDMNLRSCLRFVGGSLLSAGCIVAFYRYLFPSEKDAIYLVGHWVDVTWELLIPGASLGLLILLCSCIGKIGSGDKH